MNAPGSKPNPGSLLPPHREERALIVLVGVGAALLLASLFIGWYQVQQISRHGCTGILESFSPFWVTVTSSGTGCPPSETGSFQSAGLPLTGALYSLVGVLTAVAGLLSLALIGLRRALRPSRKVSLVLLCFSLLALSAGIGAPVLLAVNQTWTVCHDEGVVQTPFELPHGAFPGASPPIPLNQSSPAPPFRCNGWSFWTGNSYGWSWTGTVGPWNSFTGSNVSGDAVLSWGSGPGWILDLGGLALLATGPVLAWRSKPTS